LWCWRESASRGKDRSDCDQSKGARHHTDHSRSMSAFHSLRTFG
jgi:hypothetical protein